ncbi:MAG: exodeoxyribonuclease Xth, partial [Jatrophihabitantaceae bacterium]|nr:exodeoxyribonuclease Xth [Jatrophihabitantaceae bacterium]
MRIATWNVNSIKQRLPRFLPWLDERQPDVVCLQETKLGDDAIAGLLDAELGARGYQAAYVGQSQWNGVAILSRVGLDDVTIGFPDQPGWGEDPAAEARAIGATCG